MRVVVLLLCMTACSVVQEGIPIEKGPPVQVFFCSESDCSKVILSLLANATRISCAFYHITNPQLIQVLKDKQARVVTDNLYTKSVRELNVHTDRSKALMHNKFCVLDEQVVITGSYNPTNQQKEDNLVVIPSRFLAQNYLQEFDEMVQGIFHGGSPVRYPLMKYNNATIRTAFCPEDACAEHLLNQLMNAQESIRFILYQITDQDILSFLTTTSQVIQGVIDKSQIKVVPEKLKSKILFKSKIHAKMFIIDNETIVTGSYNPTKNGNARNDENLLIISDAKIAQQYSEHFKRLSTT